jgi:1-phosphatidylinositol-4-phosphate 5-kinase
MLTKQYGIIKRLEHFFKGLSHSEGQISAIPPDRYGDRFLHFIGGVTMSKEMVEQLETTTGRQQVQTVAANHMPDIQERNSSRQSSDILSDPSGAQTEKTEKVMHKAERQAQRSGDKLTELDVPERTLGTVDSNSGRRSSDSAGAGGQSGRESGEDNGQTLPVVDEAGESGSTSRNSERHSVRTEASVNGLESTNDRNESSTHHSRDNGSNNNPIEKAFHLSQHPISNLHMRMGPPLPPNRPPPTPPNDSLILESENDASHNSQRTYTVDGEECGRHHSRNSIPREPPTPPRYEDDDEQHTTPAYERGKSEIKLVHEKKPLGTNTRSLKSKMKRSKGTKESAVSENKTLRV